MKAHQSTIGKNDEWLTPPSIIQPLGTFDLDPCAPVRRPWDTAKNHFTIEDDGLSKKWFGRVWLNPPFNRFQRPIWMEKMAAHGNGVMLIPAATETEAFSQYVFGSASGICFVKKRPHFYSVDGVRSRMDCGTAIALVAYGRDNLLSLQLSDLGTTIKL